MGRSVGSELPNTNSLAYPDPLLHQVCYAAIMITSIILVHQDYRAPQLTSGMVQQARALIVTGTYTFIAGFVMWNLGLYMIVIIIVRLKPMKDPDNIYCDSLTAWRRDIGEYLGGLVQGDRVLHP